MFCNFFKTWHPNGAEESRAETEEEAPAVVNILDISQDQDADGDGLKPGDSTESCAERYVVGK